MEREKQDFVYLNPKQLQLFKFLKRHSANVSNWPSLEEITTKLKVSEKKAKDLIYSLKKIEGIVLTSETTRIEQKKRKTRYGLAPETLEVLVKPGNSPERKREFDYCSLYIGKPCFGTKAFDEKYTMKGLALTLEVNGLAKEIRDVNIQGGVIPMVPPYSSVSYLTALKFLGQIDRTNGKKSLTEKMLEEEIETDYEKKFYKEFVNDSKKKKITNLTEAFTAAEKQISILMNPMQEETVLTIQLGHEERENIRFLEQAQIQEFAKKKTDRIKAMKEDLVMDSRAKYSESYEMATKQLVLEKISSSKKLKQHAGEKRNDYIIRIKKTFENIEQEIPKVEEIWGEYHLAWENPNILKLIRENSAEYAAKYSFHWSQRDPTKVKTKTRELKKDFEKFSKIRGNLESQLEDINSATSWTKQLLEGDRAAITWFTRQYPVDADYVELGWKKVKDKFSKHFFNWEIPNPTVVHVSPRKRFTIDTGIVNNVKTGEKDKIECQYQIDSNGKKKI